MELKIELQDGWKPNECDFCIDPYGAKLNEPCPKDCPLVVAWEKKQDEEKSKPSPVEGLTEYDKGEMALDQHLYPVEEKATAEGSLVERWDSSFVKEYVATCGIMKRDFLSSTMLEEFVLAAIQEHHKRFGRK